MECSAAGAAESRIWGGAISIRNELNMAPESHSGSQEPHVYILSKGQWLPPRKILTGNEAPIGNEAALLPRLARCQ